MLDVIDSKLDAIPPERGTDAASTHNPTDVDAVIEDEDINQKLDILLGIVNELKAKLDTIETIIEPLKNEEIITINDLAPGQGGVKIWGAEKMTKSSKPLQEKQGKRD